MKCNAGPQQHLPMSSAGGQPRILRLASFGPTLRGAFEVTFCGLKGLTH